MKVSFDLPLFTGLDSNGKPVAGGHLYTYQSGTVTPATTYLDENGSASNANPIVLDSAGRATIFLDSDQAYRFLLKDASNTGTVWGPVDSITGPVSSADIDAKIDAALVPYSTTTEMNAAIATAVAATDGGRLVDIQRFAASGTWTKPSGLTANAFLIVDGLGAGGAGGGAAATTANAAAGCGGGAGRRAIFKIPATSIDATAAVVIGAGGTGNSGSAGNGGASTTLTSVTAAGVMTFPGGNGGISGSAGSSLAVPLTGPYSANVATSTFASTTQLMNATTGNLPQGDGRSLLYSGTEVSAGFGCPSPLTGGDGGYGGKGSNQAGTVGRAPGAGGGGGCNIGTQSAVAGGAGAGGYMVIYTYA